MKIYIQTETLAHGDAPRELRARQFLMETAASGERVLAALNEVAAELGALAAVPAMAHEINLKALLPRDLARLGITPAPCDPEGTAAVLTIRRTPGEAVGAGEVVSLGYQADLVAVSLG